MFQELSTQHVAYYSEYLRVLVSFYCLQVDLF